jgi:hypothetical protein
LGHAPDGTSDRMPEGTPAEGGVVDSNEGNVVNSDERVVEEPETCRPLFLGGHLLPLGAPAVSKG